VRCNGRSFNEYRRGTVILSTSVAELVACRRGCSIPANVLAGFAALGSLNCSGAVNSNALTLAEPVSRAVLGSGAIALVEGALHFYSVLTPTSVTTLDVAAAWLFDDSENLDNGLLATIIHQITMMDIFPFTVLRSAYLRIARLGENGAGVLSSDLVAVLQRVVRATAEQGRLIVTPEDIVLGILRKPCAGRTLFKSLRYGQRLKVREGLAVSAEWNVPEPFNRAAIAHSSAVRKTLLELGLVAEPSTGNQL
jgi:hypothetical protein